MPSSFKPFIQHHWLTLIFLALTLGAGAWAWLNFQDWQIAYASQPAPAVLAAAPGGTQEANLLFQLVTPTPTLPSPTGTPTSTATHTPEPTPTRTPTATQDLATWTGSFYLLLEDNQNGVDYYLPDQGKASRAFTEAFLQAFATWELVRIFSGNLMTVGEYEWNTDNDFPPNVFYGPTWITDRRLRQYNQFHTIPQNKLDWFKQDLAKIDPSFLGEPTGFFNSTKVAFTELSREAAADYAAYLRDYLVENNGVLEDVVFPQLNNSFAYVRAALGPSAAHMALSEPATIDFKKGVIIRQTHASRQSSNAIADDRAGFLFKVEFERLVIEVRSSKSTGDELSLSLIYAMEILGRAGNANVNDRLLSEDVLSDRQRNALLIFDNRGDYQPGTGIIQDTLVEMGIREMLKSILRGLRFLASTLVGLCAGLSLVVLLLALFSLGMAREPQNLTTLYEDANLASNGRFIFADLILLAGTGSAADPLAPASGSPLTSARFQAWEELANSLLPEEWLSGQLDALTLAFFDWLGSEQTSLPDYTLDLNPVREILLSSQGELALLPILDNLPDCLSPEDNPVAGVLITCLPPRTNLTQLAETTSRAVADILPAEISSAQLVSTGMVTSSVQESLERFRWGYRLAFQLIPLLISVTVLLFCAYSLLNSGSLLNWLWALPWPLYLSGLLLLGLYTAWQILTPEYLTLFSGNLLVGVRQQFTTLLQELLLAAGETLVPELLWSGIILLVIGVGLHIAAFFLQRYQQKQQQAAEAARRQKPKLRKVFR